MKKIKLLFALSLLTICNNNLQAQWVHTDGPYGGIVSVIADNGDKLFVGTQHGVFYSIDNGLNWTVINDGLPINSFNFGVRVITATDSTLFAGISGYIGDAIFRSTNNGTTWYSANNGLPVSTGFGSNNMASISTITMKGNNVFAGGAFYIINGGLIGVVYRSTNNGMSWTKADSGLPNFVSDLAVNGNNLFAATNSGVFRSTNNGENWTPTSLTNISTMSLEINSDGDIFVIGGGDGVFRSTDNGDNWTEVNNGLPDSAYVSDMCIIPNAIGGSNIFVIVSEYSRSLGIFLSSDNGENWVQVNNGIMNLRITTLAGNAENLFAGTWGGGIFRSTNYGAAWTIANNGLDYADISTFFTYKNAKGKFNLLTGTVSVFCDIDGCGQVSGAGVFLSTNSGAAWNSINSDLPANIVRCFSVKENMIFAGGLFYSTTGDVIGSVYLSTDDGITWAPADSDLPPGDVSAIAANENYIFAVKPNLGVFRSTNNGNNWTQTSLIYYPVGPLAINSVGDIFVAGWGGIFRSTDNGDSWIGVNSGLTNLDIHALNVSGTNLFTGTQDGVFLSTDNGITWNAVNNGLPNNGLPNTVFSLAASDIYLFASAIDANFNNGGIFMTTNNGMNWTAIDDGLPYTQAYELAVDDIYLYAVIGGYGIWKRKLSEIVTSVSSATELPTEFFLEQNFPNPFNPSTKIRYTIPSVIASETKQSQLVTLKVYDVLGNEVATLVNEEKPAGSYEVNFNASNLSSGIYLYTLKAGKFSVSKKLIIMK